MTLLDSRSGKHSSTSLAKCAACGVSLSRYNSTGQCSPCASSGRRSVVGEISALPSAFWHEEGMMTALENRDMGKVIRAYRMHPHHGRSVITQAVVASWGGITQAQLSRIENGPPMMHMDRLTHWAKVLRIPEHLLWFNSGHDNEASESSPGMARSDFLKMGGIGVAGGIATGSTILPGPSSAVTEQACAQWLAWELWHQKRDSIHESEIPSSIASYLRRHTVSLPRGSGFILRDNAESIYRFAHASFVDFFVAQRIFDNIAAGGSLFATAQTSHQMDLVICEFVSRDEASASALRSWMDKASSPVLRVNSAGVLAKLGPVTADTDRVVASLKHDVDARQLYLRAHKTITIQFK